MLRTLAGFLILLNVACAETAVQHLLENKLFARIRDYDAALDGALGVAAIDLTSGRVFVYNGDAVFPTASSIKIPIMVEMFRAIKRGEFQLTDTLTLTRADAAGGSGTIAESLAQGPQHYTILELMTAMIQHSDNTATNRCIALAKMERVNQNLASLGFHTIRLRRIMMDSQAARRGQENVASPIEMARLAEMLYRGKLADAADTAQMIGLMKLVKAGMRAAIPERYEVASKPGDLPGVECETGIVYLTGRPFVLSVFSTFLGGDVHPVRDITGAVFQYFQRLSAANQFGNRLP